eukprot:s2612_g9.t1
MQEMTADLAQEANEIQATENTAEKEFQTFLADSQEDRSKKQTTQQKNEMTTGLHQRGSANGTISSQTNVLSQRKVDLLATEKQLAAANDYYEELHGKCLNKSTNFVAERKRRAEELEALDKAYEMLSRAENLGS